MKNSRQNKNIVLIIIDALRTDIDMKCLKGGFRFNNYHSVSNSTFPSLTSLFNGVYPQTFRHEFVNSDFQEMGKQFNDIFWLPEYMQKKGYNTIAIDWIGLWFKRGFDKYVGIEDDKSNKIHNLKAKLFSYFPNWTYEMWKKIKKSTGIKLYASALETSTMAIEEIRKATKPYFMFVHFWDSHYPFNSETYKPTGKGKYTDILDTIKDKNQKKFVERMCIDSQLYDMYSFEDVKEKYKCALKEIDDQVMRILRNIDNNTIVFILGDHGYSLGENNIYFSNCGMNEVTYKTPLVIHGMGEGSSNELIQNVHIPLLIKGIIKNNIIKYVGVKEGYSYDACSLNTFVEFTLNKRVVHKLNSKCFRCGVEHEI